MLNVDVASLEVRHNVSARRFEVPLGEKLGLIIYHKDGDTYNLFHTEVPPEYQGQGIADHMTHFALETVQAEGGRVVPSCSFIRTYIRRHRQYAPLIAGPV
jgi:predicted GNAT family acetyltransferase